MKLLMCDKLTIDRVGKQYNFSSCQRLFQQKTIKIKTQNDSLDLGWGLGYERRKS